MQGSDRGFGKVKSFLKSSFSDCVTVGLMFSTACVLLSSTYCSRFLVGVYRHYHPWHGLSPSMSVLVCIAGPLYPRKLVVGQAEIIYILHLTTGQKNSRFLHVSSEKDSFSCHLPCLLLSSWLLTQVNRGGCLSLCAKPWHAQGEDVVDLELK